MKPEGNDALMNNTVFFWIAVATGLILLVPLIAMQFTAEVSWSRADFLVMGILLLTCSSLFVLVARRLSQKHRVAVGIGFAAAFFYVWAELAVGIFTNPVG